MNIDLFSGTCLQHAVKMGNVEFVRHFFENEIPEQPYDPNITCESNSQPPIFIVCSNLPDASLEIVKILLNQTQTKIDQSIGNFLASS